MTNSPPENAAYSEDWSSYRKLVVDTLKRLDDRTMEMYQRFFDLVGRVSALEGNEKEIDRLEKAIECVDTKADGIKSDVGTLKVQVAEYKGFKNGAMWIIGGLWAIVAVVGSTFLKQWLTSN
jgi:hypothetical protein